MQVEFESLETGEVAILRSSPRRIYWNSCSRTYRASLAKDGYGSKTVTMEIVEGRPVSVSAPFEHAARLHVAEMGSCRRIGGVPGSLAGAVSAYIVAIRADQELVQMVGWIDEHGRGANKSTPA